MKALGKRAREEHLVIHMLLTWNTPQPDNSPHHGILHPEHAEKYCEPEVSAGRLKKQLVCLHPAKRERRIRLDVPSSLSSRK